MTAELIVALILGVIIGWGVADKIRQRKGKTDAVGEAIVQIKQLRLESDDTLMLTFKDQLTHEQMGEIRNAVRNFVTETAKIIVTSGTSMDAVVIKNVKESA